MDRHAMTWPASFRRLGAGFWFTHEPALDRRNVQQVGAAVPVVLVDA
jgi:hypothetical protein